MLAPGVIEQDCLANTESTSPPKVVSMTDTGTAAALAENFDFSDAAVRVDPPAVWAELRKGPPRWSDAYGGHYDDLKEVLGNPSVFCSVHGTNLPPNGFPYPLPPNQVDPPQHAQWRKLTAPFFTSSSVKGLESSIRGVTRELLAKVLERGHCDLAGDLAQQIPAYVIADMMGFPRDDAPWFAHISDHLLETAEREQAEENAAAGAELVGYLTKHLESRREHPQNDLLTELVNGSVDGRPLTFEEMLGVAFFFLIAGHETTVGGMTFLLWRLGLNPDQRQRLTEDHSLIPKAIEESLRIDSPVLHLARTVTQDTVLNGATMKAGDKVMVLYAAGNRDEEVFPDAGTFDIDRPNAKRHLAFSSSIHLCQGAGLGRLEMRVLVEEVLDAIPDYEIDDGAVAFRSIQGVHSVKSLPVTFAPHPSRI
jgi:cytochrome P450